MRILYATKCENPQETLDYFIENLSEEENVCASKKMTKQECSFLSDLVLGACKNREEIDALIADKLKKWTITRIPRVNLAILRLAVFELCFYDDTPGEIAINEAVELAKKYSDKEGAPFINGVLGAIAEEKNG